LVERDDHGNRKHKACEPPQQYLADQVQKLLVVIIPPRELVLGVFAQRWEVSLELAGAVRAEGCGAIPVWWG
jgi:hypothetical protein